MPSNVSVKVTADVIELQTKFAIARAETNALTAEMNKLAKASASGIIDASGSARLQQVSGEMLAARSQTSAYAAELAKAGVSFRGFSSAVESGSSSIGGAVERMSGAVNTALQFSGVAVAIEAVRKLGETIHEQAERANEMRSMSEVLEVNVTQFQAMQIAAEEAGISDQTLFRGTEKLVQILADARDKSGAAIDKLHALGITNDQLKDSTFGTAEMMAYLAGRLGEDATRTATLSALRKELGARSSLVAIAIQELGDNTQKWNDKAKEANALTQEQTKYLHDAGTWWDNLGRKIANATGAVIAYMAKNEEANQKAYEATLKTPPTPTVTAVIQRGDPQQKKQEDEAKASQSKITEAVIAATKEQIEATKDGSDQRLALTRKLYQELLSLYGGNAQVDKVVEAHKKLIDEERRHSEEMVRETERGNALRRESGARAVEAIKKDMEQSSAILEEEMRGEEEAIAAREKLDQLDVAGRREHLAALEKLGQISHAQEVAGEIELENEKYATESRGLQERLALMQSEYNERQKLLDQQAAVEKAHANAIQAINDKSAEEQVTQWRKAVGEIESAEGTLVSDIFNRRQSLSRSLLQISSQFVQKEIENDIKAMTSRLAISNAEEASKKALEQGGYLYHLGIEIQKSFASHTSETAQTAATVSGNAIRTSSTVAAASTAKAVSAQTGGSTVLADAAKAFSGTYASVSQIPYVGWILAPAAASAAYAAVAGYEGMASLDVGAWNVPRDMVAQIHAGETVVPTNFAEGARQNGGFSGGDIHLHMAVNAMDASSFGDFLSKGGGGDHIVRHLQRRLQTGTRLS